MPCSGVEHLSILRVVRHESRRAGARVLKIKSDRSACAGVPAAGWRRRAAHDGLPRSNGWLSPHAYVGLVFSLSAVPYSLGLLILFTSRCTLRCLFLMARWYFESALVSSSILPLRPRAACKLEPAIDFGPDKHEIHAFLHRRRELSRTVIRYSSHLDTCSLWTSELR
jgi:hypothetical protein